MYKIIKYAALTLYMVTLTGLYSMTRLAFAVEIGDKMPDFSLQASDGKTYTLAQFHGKEPVVVAFFPKAFTQG